VALQYRILEYFEDSAQDIQYYLGKLQSKAYTYGIHFLPHDAKAKVLGTQRTIEQAVRAIYGQVRVIKRVPHKANAINAGRIIFPNCWFDERKCQDGLNRLRHYKYRVIDGQLSDEPLHDDASNAADAFMTLAQSIKDPRPKNKLGNKLERPESKFLEDAPQLGWLAF
jgi:phage terminase large subunit